MDEGVQGVLGVAAVVDAVVCLPTAIDNLDESYPFRRSS